ncbi:MAG: thioredoxin 1 [Methanolobus sp.]|jgi:thiol-disulfide isomerase/thioredoxin|nr:thioredoxin 1 [Methanolobus sp.]MDK2834929.1 thioredoxin 1 [Methanolobus sp.]MDN5309873.1 thioredoxin 1 [Methanolobus sp.]
MVIDDAVIEATDVEWDEMIGNQEKPMVVMFYLPECDYCREIEPYFREYASEFRKSAEFIMMNGMLAARTAMRYGVRGVPTFKFFCRGKPIKEEVGLIYPSILRKSIEDLIGHGNECVLHTTPLPDEVSPYE